MNKSTVVKVQNISKTYKLYNKPIDRLKESLNPFKKKYHKEFNALKNVSLELKRGKALGVIGRNGNGKSTLLKIISGVLTPTKGHIHTRGKISAILELTSNLKPELTGLENIELNLKISGFRKDELKEKIKEIEEFAEIGEFINQAVKTYSSGMKSRLGFGIATSSEPDILILDEVLAVGDFNFQQKCLAKINYMRENISMIFVSHSMNSVRLFCDNVLVLDKGENVFFGKADDGIKYYLEKEEKKKIELKKKEIKVSTKPFYGDIFHNKSKIKEIEYHWIDKKYNSIDVAKTNDYIGVYLKFKLSYKPKELIVGLPIWNIDGVYISGISTEMDKFNLTLNKDGFYEVYFMFSNIFNPGTYINIISIVDKSETLFRNKNTLLEVYRTDNRYFGIINIPHEWKKDNTKKIIDFKSKKLFIDDRDKSAISYDSKGSYEEINNKIYSEINDRFSPNIIIDIGANYGFTSLVFSSYFLDSKLVLVEASTKLIEYIQNNMKQNNITNYEVINAICAEKANDERTFAENPSGSQDNRVIGENENWITSKVNTISLDEIIRKNISNFYFIKIDTQGYEPNVFLGGESYLQNNYNWIIKTEFAPYWINSQGFEAKKFLCYLLENYLVCEVPNRTRFKGDDFKALLLNKLKIEDIDDFLNYITSYNKHNRGWCDLYIFPKSIEKAINE